MPRNQGCGSFAVKMSRPRAIELCVPMSTVVHESTPTFGAEVLFRKKALTDRELVDRARSRDRDAFGELARRHQRRLHRLALHLLRDRAEAEEVTQETFVRADGALERFDGRSEPYTWLYR